MQGRLRAGGARAAVALQPPLPRRLHRALAAAGELPPSPLPPRAPPPRSRRLSTASLLLCPHTARQLPRVPEEPHGTEHGHQPPGPDRRELLVILVLVVIQLAQQREPSRQLLSAPCRPPREGPGPRPAPGPPVGGGGGRGAAGLEPGGPPTPASTPAPRLRLGDRGRQAGASSAVPRASPAGAWVRVAPHPHPFVSNLTLYSQRRKGFYNFKLLLL